MIEETVANSVLMIRPAGFAANVQTASSNRFQSLLVADSGVGSRARTEFDGVVRALMDTGIEVEVFEDTLEPHKPDAVFPNNWVSFHRDGRVCLYPMQAANRRMERRAEILDALQYERGYRITRIEDWSVRETEGRYLEGTGSLVLDRANRLAFACLSPRTDKALAIEWCREFNYEPVLFQTRDNDGIPIYHTNVMMCIGNRFAIICPECIPDPVEREKVVARIRGTNHQVIPISMDQLVCFAGNMLLLRARTGGHVLAMSSRAERTLLPQQRRELERFADLVSCELNTIEDCGGGSMRCMIAELFLPRQ